MNGPRDAAGGPAGPGRRHTLDMTRGAIAPLLIRFAVPLLLGSLLQQLYNTVDAWVVGNYVGNEAYSAVGAAAQPVNTLISLFTGLASGVTVVISQAFGARDEAAVRRAVATAMAMTAVLSALLTLAGILIVPAIMGWMKIPGDVRPDAAKYLAIYFSGLTGMFFYNMGTGILRAVGDSYRAFLFLVAATVLNIALDLGFVLRFHMGIEGVAYATVIAQFAAAAAVVLLLVRTDQCVKWVVRETRIDREILKSVVRIGLPNAVQMMTMSFSNMFALSYVNALGADYMAGWTTYNKLEQFAALPLQSVSLACTTFTAQNIGRRDLRRVRRGVRVAFALSMGVSAAVILPVVATAGTTVAIFDPKAEAVAIGTRIVRTLLPLYLVNNVTLILSGALRGAGRSLATTIISFGSLVVLRQSYLYVVSRCVGDSIIHIAMAFPVGWFACSLLTYAYYRKIAGAEAMG